MVSRRCGGLKEVWWSGRRCGGQEGGLVGEGGVVVARRCGGLGVCVPASGQPVPGSNLGLGPPHSMV